MLRQRISLKKVKTKKVQKRKGKVLEPQQGDELPSRRKELMVVQEWVNKP